MSLVNACSIAATSKNTGTECSEALKATAQIILAPKNAIITAANLQSFTAYVITMTHAAKAIRWYPLFGSSAPIRTITDAAGNDIIETTDDGASHFIRYDMFRRTFETTEGGLCLAQALQSFIGNAYGFIEVDITGQVAMKNNGNNTWSPFPVNLLYAPTPKLANFKTTYKNQFSLDFNPTIYIGKGQIFGSDITEDLIDTTGLIDSQVTVPAGATQSVTNLFVNVNTICANTDLVTTVGAALAIGTTNFAIQNSLTKATVPYTAATVIPAVTTPSGITPAQVRLTGTFVSGQSYLVSLAVPSVLLAANVEGYEGIITATVPVP